MATYASGYSNGYQVRLEHYQLSQNYNNNTSVVRVDAYIDTSGNSFIARLNGSAVSQGIEWWNPGGGTFSAYPSGTSAYIGTYDVTVGHDSNGNATASASIWAQTTDTTASWRMPYRAASGSISLSRIPQFPSAPSSLSSSRSLLSVTVTSGTASPNGDTILEYQAERTTANQGAWSGQTVTLNGSRQGTFTGLTPGASYRFRVRARTNRGWGPYFDQGVANAITMPTAPSAPASVTPGQSSGLDIPVTVAAAASTGGEPISSYSLQWSNNNGSSWSTPVTVTAGTPYTFTNLQPGLNYLFRAYATNAVGDSATTTSSPYFLTAGGKRWDGTAWQVGTISRRWDGTQWVNITTAKRWDGSEWVVLT